MSSLVKQSLVTVRPVWNQLLRRHLTLSAPVAQSFRKWYQSMWAPRALPQPPYEHVTQIGDPVLRRRAVDVPTEAITGPEVKYLVRRMEDVLHKYTLVGVAAPQVGSPLNVMVMEFSQKTLNKFSADVQKARRMELLPLTVLINPKLTVTNFGKVSFLEGCASVRGYNAEVARYEEVTVSGYDTDGKLQELQLHGWNARIAQHEVDHLNGILYTDIMNQKTFACMCWEAVNAGEGRVTIDFRI